METLYFISPLKAASFKLPPDTPFAPETFGKSTNCLPKPFSLKDEPTRSFHDPFPVQDRFSFVLFR